MNAVTTQRVVLRREIHALGVTFDETILRHLQNLKLRFPVSQKTMILLVL